MHPDRVRGIADGVQEWANPIKFWRPAWVIESPSFASNGPGHDKVLSGWWLFIDQLMREHEWEPPLLVAPSRLKKFVTGAGNASKVQVAAAVTRHWPDAQARNDNEFDAVGLAAIGAAAHGEPFNRALTKYQQEVVEAVRLGTEKK